VPPVDTVGDVEEAKEAAAEEACTVLEDGDVVGLGTGTTASHAVRRIAELVSDGMDLEGIATSRETMELARHLDVPLTSLGEVDGVDVTIDGADAVDPQDRLIKGLGGALVREKIVASYTDREVIIVDESKIVDQLGETTPLPVEVLQFGRRPVDRSLDEMGYEATVREDDAGGVFLTDNGNVIYDLDVDPIDDPDALEAEIDRVPGVVENGLFLDLADDVVVGAADGSASWR
jgi:ribose 5-phosphate isomerase A